MIKIKTLLFKQKSEYAKIESFTQSVIHKNHTHLNQIC